MVVMAYSAYLQQGPSVFKKTDAIPAKVWDPKVEDPAVFDSLT